MERILEIEQEFFNRIDAVDLTRINALLTSNRNQKIRAFETTIELTEHALKSYKWFKSDEGKQELEASGLVLTTPEFAEKVFRKSKSQFLKLVQCGTLLERTEEPTAKISQFKRACTTAENRGEKVSRSLENFIKFLQADETNETEEPTEVETTAKTLVTFSVKGDVFEDGKGISMRILDTGEIIFNGDRDKLHSELATEIVELVNQHYTDSHDYSILETALNSNLEAM